MNGTLPILSLAELRLRIHFTLPVIKGSVGVQPQVSFILSSSSCILHYLSQFTGEHPDRTLLLLLLLMPSEHVYELAGWHFHTCLCAHWEDPELRMGYSLGQRCIGRA